MAATPRPRTRRQDSAPARSKGPSSKSSSKSSNGSSGSSASRRRAVTPKRVKNVRPDAMDFRDLMFVPTLIEVPTTRPLSDYKKVKVPILDQGSEGACTGFGLATVANYLLRVRKVVPDKVPVSARMFYENARRYDEWPGEHYSGSSARGAMKGWHKHGVCAEEDWPYDLGPKASCGLTENRTSEALKRPLGAYYRVNHKDLIAMHAAITEVGILFATASVHEGWETVGQDGLIHQEPDAAPTGGHAFAIVAYDEWGFWIQNSWGRDWGAGGFGRISYDDWLDNGTDVWVARLGAPVVLRKADSISRVHAPVSGMSAAYAYSDLRPHIISVGNDGQLQAGGDYGTTEAELARIFTEDIPRVMQTWPVKRLMLYAHGGLVSEEAAVQRLSEYRPALLASGVYPLSFIWHSDFWTTLKNILVDAVRRRRPEGILDDTKDFLLDRVDDMLEPLARALSGRLQWKEMKSNALQASDPGGAAWLTAQHLAQWVKDDPSLEINVVGHSAGAVLLGPLLQLLTQTHQLKINTCTLWAPACTVQHFEEDYAPLIQTQAVDRFTVYTLTDKAEQDDDCAGIYHKSLLYLVSNAFEDKERIPGLRDGVPLLGMQKFLDADPALLKLVSSGKAEWVLSPNNEPETSLRASAARHHGDFDDDPATVRSTFARLVQPGVAAGAQGAVTEKEKGKEQQRRKLKASAPATADAACVMPDVKFFKSEKSLRERREEIDRKSSGLP